MTKNQYNRTKYLILKLLYSGLKYYTPREISKETGLSYKAVEQRLYRLTGMDYIWRKNEFRAGNTNHYCYRKLKRKGKETFERIDEIVKLEEQTGIKLSLNLRKAVKIPDLNIGKINSHLSHSINRIYDQGVK